MKPKKIKAPYFCQYDNALYPGGSCNMTSLAMALQHYGRDGAVPGKGRLPDRLLRVCDKEGLDRHQLEAIDLLAERYGLDDKSGYGVTFDQIKTHLSGGNLVIVHGMFTPGGHIVLLCGFDPDRGLWLVNDPAGDWMAPNAYRNPGWRSGEQVWYPSVPFRKAAAPDGKVWAHLLSKKGTP